MAVGIDFGTMNIVVARKNDEGKVTVAAEKNCFFDVPTDWEDMLTGSDFNFTKLVENGEERLFVCGKDALRLANLYSKKDTSGDRVSGLRRPMQNMVLNSKSDKMSVQMLKFMVQNLVGPPKEEGEICFVSVPANPLSGQFNNNFHSMMCQQFIRELGYTVEPIPEFLAVIYASNPTMEEDGEKIPMTGVGISWGAGGTNCGVAYKRQPTVNFALDKGGDWIDKQIASVTQLTNSEVTVEKEKLSKAEKVSLSNPDFGDEISGAVYIYYDALIREVVTSFKAQFLENKINFTSPVEIVVSGGTSLIPGFEAHFEKIVKEVSWPFDISGIRKAPNPLAATAVGALNRALASEKKTK